MLVAGTGSFEIVHQGHINLINKMKALGNVTLFLVDDWVINKYKNRPLVTTLENRINNLKQLDVNVLVMNKNTEYENMQMVLDLKPDIYCFGEDQRSIWNLELESKLTTQGCKCLIIPRTPNISTTLLISKAS